MNDCRHDTASVAPGSPAHEASAPVSESTSNQVEDFIASMPKRYRQEFSRALAQQHAQIVASRGLGPIHADLFSGGGPDGPGLCVVAPDAPGLLAVISTGLMLRDFDITRADAYTRRPPGGDHEAVDFFWVRRLNSTRVTPLGKADIPALKSTLRELLSTGAAQQHLSSALSGASPGASETSVRFRENHDAPWLTLELKSNDRPGLLALVTNALASEGMQIVSSSIRTHGLRVDDTFDVIESDGTCPAGARLQRLQLAVLTAVDGPGHGGR